MKKIRIILLFLLLPLLGAAMAPVELKLNGKNLQDAPFLEKEGELYIPIKSFSLLTSLQFTQRSSGDIILFRDNIFIKFNLNSNTYYLNGKEFRWKNLPFSHEGELFIPHGLLLNFMNFQYTYDKENKILSLTSGAGYDVSLNYLENRQRVDFAEARISYTLPYFWERSSLNSFSSRSSEMTIEVKSTPLGDKSFDEAIKERLEAGAPRDFFKRPPRQLFVEGTPILNQGYTQQEDQGTYYYGFSYFILENRLIETSFYAHSTSLATVLKLEEEILLSTQFNAYTIDDMEEHYVELDAFFAVNMALETPLYANILVDNVLPLKGTLHRRIKELTATLQRGKRRFYYTFPVHEGSFDVRIPVPFGLGFHSLSLTMNPSARGKISEDTLVFHENELLLLKVSLLNTSLDEGLYLSDSNFVLSKHEDLAKISSLVRDQSYDYAKAEALLLLFKENFSPGGSDEPVQAIEEHRVSKKSAALVYAALLRQSGVPTRILSNKSQTLYAVEIPSNGRWHLIDPYGFLVGEQAPGTMMSLPQGYLGTNPLYYDF